MTRASIPWNINQVTKAFANGSLVFDNAIQRGYVWDKKRASLLVDSVLRGYTIPPIYTIRTNEKVQTQKGMVSVYDCIDGKQRCTALAKFINNEFALEGLEPFVQEDGTEIDLNGLTFAELDEDMQDTFKSYGMSVNYFTDITDEEVAEMMSRMHIFKEHFKFNEAFVKSEHRNNLYISGIGDLCFLKGIIRETKTTKAKLIVLKNCGHVCNIDSKEEYNKLIAEHCFA